jgi:hypothetical protein
VTVPPYVLPLAIVAVPTALIAAALVFAVRNWPLAKVASWRQEAQEGLDGAGSGLPPPAPGRENARNRPSRATSFPGPGALPS